MSLAPAGSLQEATGELFRRAREVLRAEPADMARARALMAAHQAYVMTRGSA